jgi:DNA polymerase-3 subunit delta
VKIAARDADRVVSAPAANIVAVLLYGPDRGLVEERAARLARTVVDDLDDPFRVADLTGAQISADPARLADEIAAQSLIGGRRLVRVRAAGNETAAAFESILNHVIGDALAVIEAGDLTPRAKLRILFEAADKGAAIACYRDDAAALETVIRETLQRHGMAPSPGALAYLMSRLGTDRRVTRTELEKLALFVGDGGEVSEEAAVACVGDSAEITLDDLAEAVAGGHQANAGRALARLSLDGVNPVAIVRALQRHFQRLHFTASLIAGGTAQDAAVAALRPPVFFKRKQAFTAHSRAWTAKTVSRALDLLLAAEIDCKTTGMPGAAICGNVVTRLTGAAVTMRSRGRR